MAVSLTLGLSGAARAGLSQTGQKQAPGQKPAVQQIKALDEAKEVLRPIPTQIKKSTVAPLQAEPKSNGAGAAAQGDGKGKTTAAPVDTKGKATTAQAGNKGGSAGAATGAKADGKGAKAPETAAANGQSKTAGKESENKAEAVEKKKTVKARAVVRGPHFVPPPPPSVPTMLGSGGDFGIYGGMPIELLSKDALKDRVKEISIQYKDACRELEDHTNQKNEKIQRAQEFEGLYKEGVVSRRELESSQKEAAEVNSDIDRLQFKVNELKGLLDRINKRLTPAVVKKSGHKLIN
jgi:hypothetical protein